MIPGSPSDARVELLRVDVATPPNPFRLRPAIEARLAGRTWIEGPEAAVARAVAHAVELIAASATHPNGVR